MSIQSGDLSTERPGETGTQSGAQSVGQLLRLRREQLGWSLPDVAVWLKIRLSYLEALEQGQVARLPGNAYAMGFLRTYAGTLGLDAEDLGRRFRTEVREVNRRTELSFPAPVPERGVPAGAIVLLGFLVIVGAYAGWYEFGGRERAQTHPIPPVPAAMLPAAPAKAPPSPQVATVMPNPNAASLPVPPAGTPLPAAGTEAGQPAGAVAVPAQQTAPVAAPAAAPATATAPAAVIPTGHAVAGVPAADSPSAVPGAIPPASGTSPVAVAAPTVPAPAAASPDTITVRATAQDWIQIRQDGKVVVDRVLHAGETLAVPAGSPATLTTGNAGATELSLGAVTTAPLGRIGAVRRNVALDPAAIRDGSIAGTPAPAPTPVRAAPPPAGSAAPAAVPVPASPGAGAAPVAAPAARTASRPARPHPAAGSEEDQSITERLNAEVVRSHTPH